MYIYIHICICVCIYIYVYLYTLFYCIIIKHEYILMSSTTALVSSSLFPYAALSTHSALKRIYVFSIHHWTFIMNIN